MLQLPVQSQSEISDACVHAYPFTHTPSSLSHRYSCIFSQEPIEHQQLLYEPTRGRYFLLNGFMACRRRHPFLLYIIENLPEQLSQFPNDVFKATGPLGISMLYRKYKDTHPNLTEEEDIFVAPSQWFIPNFNWKEEGVFRTKCLKKNWKNLSEIQSQLCQKLAKQDFKNMVPGNDTYTIHRWAHTYSRSFQVFEEVNISKIRPDVTML